MSDTPYDGIAGIYDHFQKEIDPALWASYLDSLIRENVRSSGEGRDGKYLICDLGCGTAAVSAELAGMGYDLIGIDESVSMLEKAREKAADQGRDILFLNQDIRNFELFGTVDVFVSLLDTVNHLTRKADFVKMLSRFRNFLSPGGLFIFDAATPHHLEETLGDHFFYTVEEDYALLWENHFSKRSKISTSDITLFREEADGSYRRCDGSIRERVYTDDEIKEMLENAGLTLLKRCGELTMRAPGPSEERIFYVAKRPDDDVY
jgi:SAM-dependent methyltransferase